MDKENLIKQIIDRNVKLNILKINQEDLEKFPIEILSRFAILSNKMFICAINYFFGDIEKYSEGYSNLDRFLKLPIEKQLCVFTGGFIESSEYSLSHKLGNPLYNNVVEIDNNMLKYLFEKDKLFQKKSREYDKYLLKTLFNRIINSINQEKITKENLDTFFDIFSIFAVRSDNNKISNYYAFNIMCERFNFSIFNINSYNYKLLLDKFKSELQKPVAKTKLGKFKNRIIDSTKVEFQLNYDEENRINNVVSDNVNLISYISCSTFANDQEIFEKIINKYKQLPSQYENDFLTVINSAYSYNKIEFIEEVINSFERVEFPAFFGSLFSSEYKFNNDKFYSLPDTKIISIYNKISSMKNWDEVEELIVSLFGSKSLHHTDELLGEQNQVEEPKIMVKKM